jgi:hypothetical protein
MKATKNTADAPPARAGQARTSKLVTLQQASAETGVPYASLRELVIGGHLQRVQLGESRRIWVRRADVERLTA